MVGAEGLLVDGQGPLVGGPRPRQVALGLEDATKVVDRGGHVDMLGAKRCLEDGQRPLEGGPRPGEIGNQAEVKAERNMKVAGASATGRGGVLGDRAQVGLPGEQGCRVALLVQALGLGEDRGFDRGTRRVAVLSLGAREGGEQAVQDQRTVRLRVHEAQIGQATERVLDPEAALGLGLRQIEARRQQVSGDRLAGCEAGGPRQQANGNFVGGVGGVEAVVAEREAAGHVLVVAGRREIARGQGAMFQQIGPAKFAQVGGGRAELGMLVAFQEAAGQMQGERQVAQFLGDGREVRVVVAELGPVLAEQRDAFAAREHAERQGAHAQPLAPRRPAGR